ncbi:MAG TPA: ATP-binding protein, partial [Candidatus Kapabacteria bacterium]|nr:ATP-binding protein [Candidatus Kapabacteria bacterium]
MLRAGAIIAIVCQAGLLFLADDLERADPDVFKRLKADSKTELLTIANKLEDTRDSLAIDSVIYFQLGGQPRQREVFARLDIRSTPWLKQDPTRLRPSEYFRPEFGYAIYDKNARLIAWNSSQPAVFQFDSLLPKAAGTERRTLGFFAENGPIYSYLHAFKKIQKDDQLLGYVLTSALLAVQNPTASPEQRVRSFLDHLRTDIRNDISFQFSDAARQLQSSDEWLRFNLQVDDKDPATYVARVSVTERPTQPTMLSRVLEMTLLIALTLIVFVLVGWGFTLLRGAQEAASPVLRRAVYSVYVVLLIVLARYALVALDPIGIIAGPAYQDSLDFSSFWGGGIVANPLQLFISTLFLSIISVILWLIWMPRRRLVREDSREQQVRLIVRREAGTLVMFSLLAAVGSQLLISVLGSIVDFMVLNGRIRFLVIRQILPSESELMMYLAILSLGIAFLFLGTLVLTFALRAFIFLMPRWMTLPWRVVLGTVLLGILLANAAFLFSPQESVGFGYRLAATAVLLAVSSAIIIADAFWSTAQDSTPSFLYRLPRSSRAVIFILAASALLMSPLVAQKSVKRDLLNADVVRDQSQLSVVSIEPTLFSTFGSLQDNFDQWIGTSPDAPVLEQTAFLIYATEFANEPEWNVVIDVKDRSGKLVSHFANSSAAEGTLLATGNRAEVEQLALQSGARQVNPITRSTECFTRWCNPMIAAAKLVQLRGSEQALLVSIAVWSELPALVTDAGTFELLETRENASSASELIEEGEFIVAHYRPNLRVMTNAPSLDIPAELPAGIRARIGREEKMSRQTELGNAKYITQYYVLNARAPASQASVLSVSIPFPQRSRILEFGLRLNAIGLLYGVFIAMLVLIARQLTSKTVRVSLRFRDRIFLVVLAIALLPLVVVTFVTRDLLRTSAGLEDKDRLQRDAQAINDRLSEEFGTRQMRASDTAFRSTISELAQVLGRDFNVYSTNGLLMGTSRPELHESTLLASILSPFAMKEIVFGRKTFITEPQRAGNQQLQVGYRAVTSPQSESPIAVLSVATLEEQSRIEAEVARTTSLIYGTFAALGVVLLGIGAIFAARVASPIQRLILATEHVAEGELGTTIEVDRDDEIGELMHAFNIMTAELEKSRERIAASERELAWKEMARQVAHEIKNPLTPMRLSVQHLEHAQEMKDPNFGMIFKRVMRTLGEQIDLLTRIATEFSRFGEMPRRRYRAVPVRKVVESAVALFDSERHRIRFAIDIPPTLSPIHADEEEFRRLLVNLIRNATQAIDSWGVIAIRASEDKGMIHIRLSDTGSGMDEETLAKAFDPNFSTKTSGMGLGLAIVKKTITDMSGTISVESKLGQGTTFHIEVPA